MSAGFPIVLNDVSFEWPDGVNALAHVTAAFGAGRTGLVGANGSGKSTLLRLITGELAPTSGTITTAGVVDYLPQGIARVRSDVADLLGIGEICAALRAVESGRVDPIHFETIGANWDIRDRACADLANLGLPTDLDRSIATLSSGEAMLTAIAGVRLRGADIALLDEPTNNLDRNARAHLYGLISNWAGTLIVVSHDLELLERLDATAELRSGRLSVFGGPYSQYRAWFATQQQAAQQALRAANQVLKREQGQRVGLEERIAHSQRQGRADRANRKYTPAVINDRRNSAQRSQAARRNTAATKIEAAQQMVAAAERSARDDESIRVDLPDPQVPRGRRLVELVSADGRDYVIQGPERVALIGPNGVGKTTLLESLRPRARARVGYLPQRIILNESASPLGLTADAAAGLSSAQLRNRLARLMIRQAMVQRPVGSLSGGERFRVALAPLLLADPPVELLLLDEPTNDLDIASVDQLVQALTAYQGAMIIVSHDVPFLHRLALDQVLRLDQERNLHPCRLEV